MCGCLCFYDTHENVHVIVLLVDIKIDDTYPAYVSVEVPRFLA